MSIHCPACKQPLSTLTSIPKFCSHCGSPLSLDAIEGEGTVDHLDRTTAASKPGSADPNEPMPTIAQDITSPDGAASNLLAAGSFVGPFEIGGMLGQGGMGTVYRATHCETGQRVALKILSRSVRTTDETIQRFQRESQIAASINHPRSTFVYQAGQHQGQFYITMELMNGGTLSEVVKDEGAIPVSRSVDYILDIISGLQAAHQAGIVHRDLKPSNCFLDHQGRVKVGDFGLAKSFLMDSSLTQTGAFMGTPQYAAPEQLRASEIDERADIYAIGGTLFFLLTGRPPFVGNAAQVIASIASEVPPKVDSLVEHVPDQLTQTIHQTLEKDPDRRPEHLESLRQMLLPFSTDGSVSADLGRRLAAFFIDIAAVGFMVAIFGQLGTILTQVLSQIAAWESSSVVFLFNSIIGFFVATMYFSVQESFRGSTVGKWLLGMRVISDRNQRSGFFPSLVRASLVPGMLYMTVWLAPFLLGLLDPGTFDQIDRGIWVIIQVQFFQLLSWFPVLLCFVTAKKENGYRGWHEILTGSRVVRLAGSLETTRPQHSPVTLPVGLQSPEIFGEFQVTGILGRSPAMGTTLFLGHDEALDRNVWIHKRDPTDGNGDEQRLISDARKTVARTARLRILAESNETDSTWVAVEAVQGMPLMDYVRETSDIDWRSFLPILRDMADELGAAEKDGTLPDGLSVDSVWIDQQGIAKLLDAPIIPARDLVKSAVAGTDSAQRSDLVDASRSHEQPLQPFELFVRLLDGFIDNQVVPAHVLTFRTELETIHGTPDMFEQVGARLGELAELPAAWRWDDRLGVFATTLGIELSMVTSLFVIFVLVAAFFMNMGLISIALLSFGICSGVAIAFGAMMGGGPAFRIAGVMVRKNKTLEPASKIRSALRNWVAWLPIIAICTCTAIILQQAISVNQDASELDQTASVALIVAALAVFVLFLVVLVTPLYSILRPSRGLPDLISGTRLIRK